MIELKNKNKVLILIGSMNGDHFEWAHSHGKINKPRGAYNPRGIFMYFDNYNVEVSPTTENRNIKLTLLKPLSKRSNEIFPFYEVYGPNGSALGY